MKWYGKYKQIFEKSPDTVPDDIIDKIKKGLSSFKSKEPVATVAVIAHNEEKRILACLWSISENIASFPIEVIVIDNNSTDRTTQLLDKVGAIWYEESRKGPGYARQAALNKASGKYYLCIDSDTLYPPHYIAAHIKTLKKKGVVCASGTYSFFRDERFPASKLFWYELLRDIYNIVLSIKRPELCVRGAVFSFEVEEGRKIGFRTDILRGEDGSLAYSMMRNGGKYKYIISHRARAVTSNSFFESKESFSSAVASQIKKAFSGFSSIFRRQKGSYTDDESNKIQ